MVCGARKYAETGLLIQMLKYLTGSMPVDCLRAIPCNYGHDTKNKSSYAEYLVLGLYCTHITCHGFKGNIQIQLLKQL